MPNHTTEPLKIAEHSEIIKYKTMAILNTWTLTSSDIDQFENVVTDDFEENLNQSQKSCQDKIGYELPNTVQQNVKILAFLLFGSSINNSYVPII